MYKSWLKKILKGNIMITISELQRLEKLLELTGDDIRDPGITDEGNGYLVLSYNDDKTIRIKRSIDRKRNIYCC